MENPIAAIDDSKTHDQGLRPRGRRVVIDYFVPRADKSKLVVRGPEQSGNRREPSESRRGLPRDRAAGGRRRCLLVVTAAVAKVASPTCLLLPVGGDGAGLFFSSTFES